MKGLTVLRTFLKVSNLDTTIKKSFLLIYIVDIKRIFHEVYWFDVVITKVKNLGTLRILGYT